MGSWVIPRGPAERRREKAMKAQWPHRYEEQEQEQEQKQDAAGGKIHTHASENEKREAHMSSLQTPHVFLFYIWFRLAQRSTGGRKVEWWLKAYDIRIGRERGRELSRDRWDLGRGVGSSRGKGLAYVCARERRKERKHA